MKKSLKSTLKYGFLVFTMALFVTSCSSDDGNIFDTPTDDTDTDGTDDSDNDTDDNTPEVATLVFNEADSSSNIATATASGEVGTSVPGRVIFTSDATTQRRMYITQNISGQGDMPFNSFDLDDTELTKVLKADGSIDLDGATKKAIDFTFDLPVPDIDNGEIVYTFWTTKGKGDFRDIEKRLALGAGTITVTVGTGTNAAAPVREFTGIRLDAPLEDGSSETFFSFLDEKAYVITDGPEYRAFWDFGYYYTSYAAFSSTSNYKEDFNFDVEGFEPSESEEDWENESLNNTYFALSSLLTSDFDAITLSSELDDITSSGVESIKNLEVGNVIEFVDNYGKKGLIKITKIQGTFNSTDYIEFDVKIQP